MGEEQQMVTHDDGKVPESEREADEPVVEAHEEEKEEQKNEDDGGDEEADDDGDEKSKGDVGIDCEEAQVVAEKEKVGNESCEEETLDPAEIAGNQEAEE